MQKLEKIDELEYLHISNSSAEIKISLHGAHIFYFKAKGKKELLYLSESAVFKQAKAIRGGIPICWPWFGEHPADKNQSNHGFARTSIWKHIKTVELNDSETEVYLELASSQNTLRLWPYHFELQYKIHLGDKLTVSLTTKNTDAKAFTITQALHTYFKIDDISRAHIIGLDKKPFYNKIDNSFNNVEDGDIYFNAEVDRVYSDVDSQLCIDDEEQKIIVKTDGAKSAVVWNPGELLVEKMPDLHSHKQMLCLESANVFDNAITLEKGESHTLSVTFLQQDNR